MARHGTAECPLFPLSVEKMNVLTVISSRGETVFVLKRFRPAAYATGVGLSTPGPAPRSREGSSARRQLRLGGSPNHEGAALPPLLLLPPQLAPDSVQTRTSISGFTRDVPRSNYDFAMWNSGSRNTEDTIGRSRY